MFFSNDLYRKNEMAKIEAMESFGKQLIKGKDMALAFVTSGYEDTFDCYCVIPNKAVYEKFGGFILFSEDLNKPVFVSDREDV